MSFFVSKNLEDKLDINVLESQIKDNINIAKNDASLCIYVENMVFDISYITIHPFEFKMTLPSDLFKNILKFKEKGSMGKIFVSDCEILDVNFNNINFKRIEKIDNYSISTVIVIDKE